MSKILLAGPWVGEFGWELFCWQGYVRRMSKNFDETIILSRSGHEFLYKDFATKFIPFDAPASKANMWLGDVDQNRFGNVLKNQKPNHILRPFNIGYSTGSSTRIANEKFRQQDYVKYKSDTIDKKYDILLHARNKIVGSVRNWDFAKWEKLANMLSKDYTLATIGSREAFGFNGIDDYRNLPIQDTVSLMNRTKLVVGQSSGAMHLASLSGTPHFVWSDSSNNLRYKEHWNPFKTKVIFYDKENWNPKVNTIYDEIKRVL